MQENSKDFSKQKEDNLWPMRLNKFIARSGLCARREADILITQSKISVNGNIVVDLGYKVQKNDIVKFKDAPLNPEVFEYILLNKPKDFITTTYDPQDRKTVMQLVKTASDKRLYPVGRLDRNSTGLLILTNDGELAEHLTHPSSNIEKVYHVLLNKSLKEPDFIKIQSGLHLEDGFIKPDEIAYPNFNNKKEIGITIHSGKNHIIRRIFKHLHYEVIKLDRVLYHTLTKKDLPRGKWRRLTKFEILALKKLSKP